jgi:hypothetical protein
MSSVFAVVLLRESFVLFFPDAFNLVQRVIAQMNVPWFSCLFVCAHCAANVKERNEWIKGKILLVHMRS